MAQSNFFQPGFDEQIESQNIERQRKYAELLRQQADQAPQSQMVSGRYVAPSVTQGLANMLKSYQSGQGMREADEKQKGLAEAITGRRTEEIAEFTKRLSDPNGIDAAYQYAASARTPALQQAGFKALADMPEIKAKAADRQEDRAFRSSEREALANQRMTELQMRMEDNRALQSERLAAQKELRALVASNRPERQAQIIQTDSGPMQLINGQAVPIPGLDGKPIAAPKKNGASMSPTIQKEVFEADDVVQNSVGAISSINKAKELNDKAYSGVGASTRAAIRSNLPFASEGADATVAMENIIKDQALGSMKAIFGGNPTEGERSILLDLQASANKTPAQRKEILDRAAQAAQRRLEFNKQKGDALRNGTYMTTGGAPSVPVAAPTAPATAPAQMPAGFKVIR